MPGDNERKWTRPEKSISRMDCQASLLVLAMAITIFHTGSAQTHPRDYQVFLPVIYKQYSPGLPTATPTIGPPTPTASPTPWPTPTPVPPTPTPIPCDVVISSQWLFEYSCYGPHLVVVGELSNLSVEWSYWLIMRLILFDSEGFVVLSETTSAFYEPLPGDHTWFRFDVQPPLEWASYELILERCTPSSPPDYPNLTLSEVSIIETESSDCGKVYNVVGVVTNDDVVGAQPGLGVAFYDSTGSIWQADYNWNVPYLLPRQRARFDIPVGGPVEGYTSYEVRAWAY